MVTQVQKQLQVAPRVNKKLSSWLVFSLGAAAMFAFSYMLLVLTNMQTMNQAIYQLNGNVGQMNQQIGTISRAAEPIADMASPMRPFTKMFGFIMPF
ncbi:MAG: Unknown protein [uncultured Thiotrichaceae bacterium]|uniref:Uncharacterized protein n=1 Tax=uncultured Thiotrichaceae bacterium TaxID=298394 RepID=A0A6S6SF61_9GAMM|nr:MAG: Unknown protein [uncultured Thiotrichaceae bacterium]